MSHHILLYQFFLLPNQLFSSSGLTFGDWHDRCSRTIVDEDDPICILSGVQYFQRIDLSYSSLCQLQNPCPTFLVQFSRVVFYTAAKQRRTTAKKVENEYADSFTFIDDITIYILLGRSKKTHWNYIFLIFKFIAETKLIKIQHRLQPNPSAHGVGWKLNCYSQ